MSSVRAATTILPFSTGSGDAATEDALDHELREEQEGQWFRDIIRTTRDHLPCLSDCSYSDTDSERSDVIMDEGWPYDADIDMLPEYVIGIEDYDTGAWTPNSKERELERERPDGTTGPRDHAGTPNGATGPPILDPPSNDFKPG